MRLLHTADWHVGKGLQGRSRLEEHAAVLEEITAIARDRKVDLIAVAGDLFDTASPTPEAERVVYQALLDLRAVAPVVVVPGNHDSERRLQAVASVFDRADVTIRPFVRRDPLEFTFGGETTLVATLPWISQRYIVKAEQLMSLDSFELSGEFRERLRNVITLLCKPFREDTVNLLVGHVTIAGAAMGGGERTAQTIFEYWIDPAFFSSSAHYVALGHLHKTQRMPGPCPIHYSGAPLHLDFSDDEAPRHVLVAEIHPGVPAVTEEVPLTAGRRLRTITGTFKQLEKLAGTTGDDLLRVIVRDRNRTGLGDEIRGLFPEAVKVIVESPEADAKSKPTLDRSGLSPQQLFERYLDEREITDPDLVAMFSRLYEEVV